MKSFIGKSILLLGITTLGVGGISGCAKKKVNNDHELNIICLNRGYGREWIDAVKEKWEEQNPGYTVNLKAESSADDLINKNLYSRDNIDDLYIGCDKAWKTYALKGKLLELDDLLEEEVDGVKVVDKINDEYDKSIYFNGHTYRLPWTSGVPGIYYNSAMFEKYGWSIPTTVDELITLCTTIKNAQIKVGDSPKATDLVKPFVFTGENMDYFDYAVFTWWGQLAGINNVQDYLKYQSAATFSSSNAGFTALGNALKQWWEIFGDQTNYVADSKTWTNHLAQQSFYNGYAAMMINCDWLYNETLKYTSGSFREGFDLRIMKTPLARGASEANRSVSYIVGEDQYFAVPKTTIKANLAKSFIKLMISDWGIENFAEKARGTLAYKSTETIVTEDGYTNSLFEYLSATPNRFTNWSDSKLFQNGVIDVWSENSLAPYSRIFNSNKSNPVDNYLSELSSNAASSWSKWVATAGQ
ncbi:MAG: extracellular solute-binding protein [Bacilli bacterium]|nr:extracellular solute-binding protein [Bacilli bacterium]